MTTRDDVTAALSEAANHRQLKADLINDLTGDVIHANTCVVCLMDWPCTSAVLAREVERLSGGISVASRAIANITAAIQHEVNNDTFERIMDTAILFSGPAATHGPADTTGEEA